MHIANMALIRMKQGLSLATMAKLIGISKSRLSEIENGARIPSHRIAEFKKYYGGE